MRDHSLVFQQSPRRIWLIVLILAFLLHLCILSVRFDWLTPSAPRIEVQNFDSKKLEQLKKQWKQKSLLLDKDPSAPKDKTAPDQSRYESDRNIHVEKEQRSANVLPLPEMGKTQNSPKKKKAKSPQLGDLGIPFKLNSKVAPTSDVTSKNEPQDDFNPRPTGDQSILDDDLPIGSENLLNAQESIYYSFHERIHRAVAPIWYSLIREALNQVSLQKGDYVTVLEVVFDEKGNIVEIRRLQSSGISSFDLAAEQSWRKVERFPNPPKGLLNPDRKFALKYVYRVGPMHQPWAQYVMPPGH